MSLEIEIHVAQTSILCELLFHPHAGFGELQKPTGLSSDHFAFHISQLVDRGLVEKLERGSYRLTISGKEYANRLDTDNNTVERQPKVAVFFALERQNDARQEFLFQKRLKNPYYGFWGFPSGKIRWGETIIEAAQREALEETGLEADFKIAGVYHEHAYQAESGELLEDKIFFVAHGTNPRGKLMQDFEGGHNEWLTLDELRAKDKKYESIEKEIGILTSDEWLSERKSRYTKEHF